LKGQGVQGWGGEASGGKRLPLKGELKARYRNSYQLGGRGSPGSWQQKENGSTKRLRKTAEPGAEGQEVFEK